jgi:endonuclease/exonuclease/phosphatase family metal-dependent hydrolase
MDSVSNMIKEIDDQNPDIIAVCELGNLQNGNYMTNYILGNSLNVNGETKWQAAAPTNQSGSYLINGLFYDKTKFMLMSQPIVVTDVRDINIYKLKSLQTTETTYFYVVVLHLKAGNDDQVARTEMISELTNYLSILGSNENFIIVGDFNVYKSSENCFQLLVDPSDPAYTFHDPINQLGNWNDNDYYSDYHTQSTHNDYSNDCFSYGGMDDRFDFILVSSSIKDGTANIKYVDDSYFAVGQDGNRFNSNLTNPTNTTLPSNVINALYNMSDHLPVIAEFQIGDNSSVISLSSTDNFYANVVNPSDGIIRYQLKTNLKTNVNVNIYTSVGQKVYSTQINSTEDGTYTHDISNFANGIYIMSFEGEGIYQSYKIVKK